MQIACRVVPWLKRTLLLVAGVPIVIGADPFRLDPAHLQRIGTVSERFQSYNVEMVEVTGGRFWAPYAEAATPSTQQPKAGELGTPAVNPAAFRIREPLDLANPRLRKLAAALGPAYVRVSGTWANSTYFHDSDGPAPQSPPAGFGGILTRKQWRGVVDFSRAVNAEIVTSFAISAGVRDSKGVWTSDQAGKILDFTKTAGGKIAAAEFFNEPSFASIGGTPKGYDAAAYARDFAVFLPFVRKAAPGMLVLGPGSLGEAWPVASFPILKTEDLLKATGPGVDAFSYHFYGAASRRCGGTEGALKSTPDGALSEDWLSRTAGDYAFYAALRDRFEPGKPIWLTETAESACGGNPWAASFIDSFRYLDQLGRLAKSRVQVIAHNTLAASDYALIDEATMEPRPNYWSALLWRKLMGTTVLDAGKPAVAPLHVYAHCLRGNPGGVAVLAINVDRANLQDLSLPMPSSQYLLTAGNLLGGRVDLNGRELKVGAGDSVPELKGKAVPSGAVQLPPASISFFAIPNAGNPACR